MPAAAAAAAAPAPAAPADDYAPDEIFKAAWHTYRAVVAAGLMGHADVAAAAVAAIQAAAERAGGPVAVLDLGCGDAAELLNTIAASGAASCIARYVGVDASPPALALARANAAAALPGVPAEFREGDLLAAVTDAAPNSYGVILAVFAAHHLESSPDAGKGALVVAAKKALAPGGALFIGDVFLDPARPDDTVPAWRDRINATIRGEWGAKAGIGEDDAGRVADHVTTCDIPAQVTDYKAWGRAAGFDAVEEVAAPDCDIGVRAVVLR